MPDPLWERLLVAATGPAVTAILALLVVNQVASTVQRRRDASEIRERLATEMTEAANSLYFALQSYWRAAREIRLSKRKDSPVLQDEKRRLDEAYLSARIRGQIIERRLLIYYRSKLPAQSWHRVFDLLTVRYFLLFEHEGQRRQSIRARNAGPRHSGLDESQLNQPTVLLREIRMSIAKAVEMLWRHRVDRQGRHLMSSEVRTTWNSDGVPAGPARMPDDGTGVP